MDRRTELRYQLHPVWKRTSTKQYKTITKSGDQVYLLLLEGTLNFWHGMQTPEVVGERRAIPFINSNKFCYFAMHCYIIEIQNLYPQEDTQAKQVT